MDQNDLFKISKFAVFFVYASATELHQVDPNTVKPEILLVINHFKCCPATNNIVSLDVIHDAVNL